MATAIYFKMVYINMSKMIHNFALGSSLRNKRTLGVSKSLIDLSELLVQNLYNINKVNLEIDPQISSTCCTAIGIGGSRYIVNSAARTDCFLCSRNQTDN